MAGEPLRVGIDIPEPKLIKKVDISYPILVEGPVVLEILINETGEVSKIKPKLYDPAILEAATSAVREWRFSPTYRDHKAVSIEATVVVVFTMNSNPLVVDLGKEAISGGAVSGWIPTVVRMDCTGKLKPFDERVSLPNPSVYHGLWVIPDPDVPFSVLEEAIKTRIPMGMNRLETPKYRFSIERLYYSVLLVSSGSNLIQRPGGDPDVHPPKFDVDLTRLANSMRSQYPKGAVLFYTIFVDEKGAIQGIETSNAPKQEIVDAFSRVQAIKAGDRNGIPVPTAVLLAIPVQ